MIRKLLLVLICLCFFTGSVAAASDEIKSLEVSVEVYSGGTCHVTLTVNAQFASTAKEFLIPLGTGAYDIHASGDFDTEKRDGVKYAIFENPYGFSGSQSFTCSYSLPCTMGEDEYGQYFTLQVPEQGFSLPINRYQITVKFPVDVTELPVWKSSYYQEDIDNYLDIKVTDNVVTASSRIAFRDHETMTMELDFQPNSFDLRHLPGQTKRVDVGFFLITAMVCICYWALRLRNKALRIHPLQAVNLDSSAGELPCQLHGLAPDLATLLAYWGNCGYVVLRKNRRGHLFVEKTMDMGNERKPAEQRLFHALFSRSDHCEIPSTRFWNAVKVEGEQLRASWMHRLFVPKSGNPFLLRVCALLGGGFASLMCFDLLLAGKPSRWFWLVVLTLLGVAFCYAVQQVVYAFSRRDGMTRLLIGSWAAILLLLVAWLAESTVIMVLNLGLQFFCAFVTRFGGRRSEPGTELLTEVLGLRRFLRKASPEMVHRLLAMDSQYFYRMLPYAEMMGLGNVFIRHFGSGGNEPCRWLICEQRTPRNALEFYTLYHEIMTEVRRGQQPSRRNLLSVKELLAKRPVKRSADRKGKPASPRQPEANRRRTETTRRRTETARRKPEAHRRPADTRRR